MQQPQLQYRLIEDPFVSDENQYPDCFLEGRYQNTEACAPVFCCDSFLGLETPEIFNESGSVVDCDASR